MIDSQGHDLCIFKITDLDTADDNFGFGLPSKVKLFVVLNDPKTKGETICEA